MDLIFGNFVEDAKKMTRMVYPSISILIPTLNAAAVLGKCLSSISLQDYPKDKIETIIADGGSTDETLKIAKVFKAKIFENLLKTGEAGKAVALRQSQKDLVALIDSDNILPEKDWLKKMIEPFLDPDIIGSEPWEFTYRKQDSFINRYFALIGANDPYCYFVGNFDKRSALSEEWTTIKLEQVDKGKYIKAKMEGKFLPTVGANGTIWRRNILQKIIGKNNYLFDTDIPYLLAENSPFYFAKVKVGIVHLYCRRFRDFYRKQKRRAKDFFFLEKKKKRVYTYQKQKSSQLKFIFSVILIFPLIFQSVRGYLKKPDTVWLFHPFACLMTLWVYGTETILSFFKTKEMNRDNWRQ